MRCKKIIIVGIFIIALIIVIFIYKRQPDGITMAEAIQVSYDYAKKWEEDCKLIQIISTDASDTSDYHRGEKGKRYSWNIFYTSESSEKQYNILVVDGNVKYKSEVQIPVYQGIDPVNNSIIDSDQALAIAKKTGLKPVPPKNGWAVGYHYSLQYVTNDSSDTYLALLVYGELNGNFSYAIIEPYTSRLITVMQQTGYDKNGRSVWIEKEL